MNEFSPKAETNDMEQPRTVERFAMLVVSSCSEHRFICRRQRGAPSQLTVVVTRISNSIIRFHTVYNHDFSHITQLING